MKSIYLYFTLLLLSIVVLKATPQRPDKLNLGDEVIYVHGFDVNQSIRKRMEQAEAKHGNGYMRTSTANHRGFIANLELKNGKLFLKEVKIKVHSKEESEANKKISKYDLKNLTDFEKTRVKELIKVTQNAGVISISLADIEKEGLANWFTGKLIYYHGKPLSYTYTHRLSQARVITFTNGLLVKDEEVNIPESKKANKSQ